MRFTITSIAYLFVVFSFTACFGSLNKRIEITSEYIINENWDEQANAIQIKKMRVKDGRTLDLNLLSQENVLERLEEDSSFTYVANVRIGKGESYKDQRVYFNKDNGFYWWTDNGEAKTKTIGNLQKGCWYKFSHLVTYPYYVYVFADSANKIFRQDVNLANY
jgi:hypothetical protein